MLPNTLLESASFTKAMPASKSKLRPYAQDPNFEYTEAASKSNFKHALEQEPHSTPQRPEKEERQSSIANNGGTQKIRADEKVSHHNKKQTDKVEAQRSSPPEGNTPALEEKNAPQISSQESKAKTLDDALAEEKIEDVEKEETLIPQGEAAFIDTTSQKFSNLRPDNLYLSVEPERIILIDQPSDNDMDGSDGLALQAMTLEMSQPTVQEADMQADMQAASAATLSAEQGIAAQANIQAGLVAANAQESTSGEAEPSEGGEESLDPLLSQKAKTMPDLHTFGTKTNLAALPEEVDILLGQSKANTQPAFTPESLEIKQNLAQLYASSANTASVPQVGMRQASAELSPAESFSDLVNTPYGLRGLSDFAQTLETLSLEKAAPLNQHQAGHTLRPTPLQMLPVEIGMQAMRGTNSFQIRLDPAELGRVDVKLEVNSQGEVNAHLIVERPETLQMLRRDANTLHYAFEQAGLKSGQDGLSFSLRGEGQNSQQQGQNAASNGQENDQPALNVQMEQVISRRILIPNSSIDRMV